MTSYPATIIALDDAQATARIDATRHLIAFSHEEHNAVPLHLRTIGAQGVICFPKAPPHFTDDAA